MLLISDNDHAFTEQTFKTNVDSLVKQLVANGAHQGSRIAVLTRRDSWTVISFCSILKLGGVLIPVDEQFPEQRIDKILEDSHAEYYLQDGRVFVREKRHDFFSLSDNVAYIIYTSGTTASPKGVVITVENLRNYVEGFEVLLPIQEEDRFLISTSMAFDLSYTGLFVALHKRCSIRIASKEEISDIENLLKIIINEKITVLKITPSILSMMMIRNKALTLSAFHAVRLLIIGGEKINAAHVQEVLNANLDLVVVNHYGPCETTIGCCAKIITKDNIAEYMMCPTIGKPFAGNQIMIIDSSMKSVPCHKKGRLLITGPGVGMGYLSMPKGVESTDGFCLWQNQAAFLTSDIGLINDDGEVVLCGREDSIVKWKGYRISLQEIESQIIKLFCIDQVKCMVEDKNGRSSLICYYMNSTKLPEKQLRKQLSLFFPEYMIPQYFYRVKLFCQTGNGKVDVSKLEVIQEESFSGGLSFTEQAILQCWVRAGGIPGISSDEPFSSYNMDSLMEITFLVELENAFPEIRFSHRLLVRLENINNLAVFIDSKKEHGTRDTSEHEVLLTNEAVSYFRFFISAQKQTTFPHLPTQRYYQKSGIVDNVIMSKVISLPYSLNDSAYWIQQWIHADCTLRTTIDSEKCTIISPEAINLMPIITYSLDSIRDLVKKIQICQKTLMESNLCFLPICIPVSEKETVCVFLFRHFLCRTEAIATLVDLIDGVVYPDMADILKQLAYSSLASCESDSSFFEYSERTYLICSKHFQNLDAEKYVSPYLTYRTSLLYQVVPLVDLLITWTAAQALGKMLDETNIPISIWKNHSRKSLLELYCWDLSDFEFYCIDRTEDYASAFKSFYKNAAYAREHNNWQIIEALNTNVSVPHDSIYVNIIEDEDTQLSNISYCGNETVKSVEAGILAAKQSSIHGICIYGKINRQTQSISLCFSSNYYVTHCEQFLSTFNEILTELLEK